MKPIAHIRTAFRTKFGVPRQAGVVAGLEATIVFEPEYRRAEAFRGLEEFSHIWLIWDFSEAHTSEWHPTVRPPRLGGNQRMGVFATRSPFRPNPLGLSSVRLVDIDYEAPEGPLLHVEGADLMDGTPIFDVKPYLAFTDSHPEATGGFTDHTRQQPALQVEYDLPAEQLSTLTPHLSTLTEVLAHDPRPHYHSDPSRIYALEYADLEVRFRVDGTRLTVCEVALQ